MIQDISCSLFVTTVAVNQHKGFLKKFTMIYILQTNPETALTSFVFHFKKNHLPHPLWFACNNNIFHKLISLGYGKVHEICVWFCLQISQCFKNENLTYI